jgi:hypothetical protein
VPGKVPSPNSAPDSLEPNHQVPADSPAVVVAVEEDLVVVEVALTVVEVALVVVEVALTDEDEEVADLVTVDKVVVDLSDPARHWL